MKPFSRIGIPVDTHRIVSQQPHDFGCSYASILNALQLMSSFDEVGLSSELTNEQRINELSSKYGGERSQIYSAGPRERPQGGMHPVDLLHVYNSVRNELKLTAVAGDYLSCDEHDTPKAHLSRIHSLFSNSLRVGEPVVLNLRSMVVKSRNFVQILLGADSYYWAPLSSHFVTVTSISEHQNEDGSFVLDYLDSDDGTLQQMLVSADVRPFGAFRHDKLLWLENLPNYRPFLSAFGGRLLLKTNQHPFYRRTIVYLHFAMFAVPAENTDQMNLQSLIPDNSSELEQQVRLIFDNMPVGILQLTASGLIWTANPYFFQLTGYKLNELHRRSVLTVIDPGLSREALVQRLSKCDQSRVTELKSKTGARIPVLVTSRSYKNLDANMLMLCLQPIQQPPLPIQ